MNTILGGTFTSRLIQNLREQHGYTYGAHSRFELRRGPGPFWAGAAVKTEVTEDAVRQFLHELGRLAERAGAEGGAAQGQDRRGAGTAAALPAQRLGRRPSLDLWVHDLPLGYYARFAKKVRAVTAADVRRLAKKYATPDGAAIVVVGDRKTVVPQLERLGLKNPEVRDAEGVLQK